jgi:exopolysaccharide biosynthesis WecB/TagA/CpsF family protein
VKLLNIEIDNLTMDEALKEIDTFIIEKKNALVVTPNVDHLVKVENDKEFRKIYNEADLILTDGMPLIWISKFKSIDIKEKISGSDLFPQVCDLASKRSYKLYLLGGKPEASEKAAEKLVEKYPGLNIVGKYSPYYGFEKDVREIEHVIKLINDAKPDILAVGLGAPKQEKFIYNYRHKLQVPVSLAIGASIDFESGLVSRSPVWMQKSGLEWFYRMCKEPKRMIRRYLFDDMKIFKLLFKYK